MELLEKLPDVRVKGDGAKRVKHVSCGSANKSGEKNRKKDGKVFLSRVDEPIKDTFAPTDTDFSLPFIAALCR